MKSILIQLLVLPRGLAILGLLCGINLLLCSMPTQYLAEQGGDEFPGNRQGGGTHMGMFPEAIQSSWNWK
ncbi:MAG: hypothetical protein AAGE59_08440 [Cyanobacteria bacterium P01_F01_bin.86]